MGRRGSHCITNSSSRLSRRRRRRGRAGIGLFKLFLKGGWSLFWEIFEGDERKGYSRGGLHSDSVDVWIDVLYIPYRSSFFFGLFFCDALFLS